MCVPTTRLKIAQLSIRILPIMTASSCMMFTTRMAVSLVATGMMESLSMDRSQFGFSISVYSIAYAGLIVLASSFAARFQARTALAAMIVAFACTSAGTAGVTSYAGLIGVRVVLGATQAAWIPTISSYNRQFFREHMSQAQSLSVSLGSSFAQVLPLGAGILFAFRDYEKSWQYLFIIEAIPTLLLAPLVFFFLPSSPRGLAPGGLLSDPERAWLLRKCDEEERLERNQNSGDLSSDGSEGKQPTSSSCGAFVRLLRDYRVGAIALISFLAFSASTGLKYWAPTIIAEADYSEATAALLTIIPYCISSPVSIAYSYLADRSGMHLLFSMLAQVVSTLGSVSVVLALRAATPSVAFLILAFTTQITGSNCMYNSFVGYQSAVLPTSLFALGMAFINMFGSSGTIVGPFLVGYLVDRFSFAVAMASLTGLAIVALVLQALLYAVDSRRSRPLMLSAPDA